MLYIAASKVFRGTADVNSMKTKIATIHRLESGRRITIPAGLSVIPDGCAPATASIQYWLENCPPKADDEIESHFRNVGFGFRANEVETPALRSHYENRPLV